MDVLYTPSPEESYMDAALQAVLQVCFFFSWSLYSDLCLSASVHPVLFEFITFIIIVQFPIINLAKILRRRVALTWAGRLALTDGFDCRRGSGQRASDCRAPDSLKHAQHDGRLNGHLTSRAAHHRTAVQKTSSDTMCML